MDIDFRPLLWAGLAVGFLVGVAVAALVCWLVF